MEPKKSAPDYSCVFSMRSNVLNKFSLVYVRKRRDLHSDNVCSVGRTSGKSSNIQCVFFHSGRRPAGSVYLTEQTGSDREPWKAQSTLYLTNRMKILTEVPKAAWRHVRHSGTQSEQRGDLRRAAVSAWDTGRGKHTMNNFVKPLGTTGRGAKRTASVSAR